MKRQSTLTSLSLAGLLALGAAACSDHPQPLAPDGAQPLAAAAGANVIQVAPPTGNAAQDRASILAALEQVRAGGTVQFQPGIYLIGSQVPDYDIILVTVPRVTLRGHPGGTTMQGCDPAEMAGGACTGFLLSGGRQTVRDFTFVDMEYPVVLGLFETTVGGYLVEGNTFRNSTDGVWAYGDWSQPAVIRNNRFINIAIPIDVSGRTHHVLDNEISAPQPELVPFGWGTWQAVSGYGFPGPCDHNVFARNRIEGYIDGIGLRTFSLSCSHNVIRDNTIRASGAPPEIVNYLAAAIYLSSWFGEEGLVQHNLIQGNHILGAEGAAIQLGPSAGNRLVNNTIAQVTPKDGFADGIHVYSRSHENQLLGNTFGDVPGYGTRLWGNRNHVATSNPSETVWIWDQAIGNRVTGPGSVVVGPSPFAAGAESAEAAPAAAPAIPERAALRMLRQRERAEAMLERLAPLLQRAAPR
jgi:hypothetical protein